MKITGIWLGIALLIGIIIIPVNLIDKHSESDNSVLETMKQFKAEVFFLVAFVIGLIIISILSNPSPETEPNSY
ncbi:MAG: hypothetical protein P8X70_03325 [Nanoarchaeota archaeon]